MAALLDQILVEGSQAPDIGLSIVFWPVFAESGAGQVEAGPDEPRRIIAIRHVESVDLVFEPAAGGRILQALSSAASSPDQNRSGTPSTVEAGLAPANHITHQGDEPPMEPEISNPQSTITNLNAWNAAVAESAAAQILAASNLPAASRQRLAAGTYPNPEALSAAIEAERAFLAQLAQDQVVQIGGQPPRSPQISGLRTSLDQIALAAEALIAGARPPSGVAPLSGIRELYTLLSGDYEMTGVFQAERIQFGSVNSATMAGLVANSLNKRVMNLFEEYPRWWEPVVAQEDFTTLQQVRWVTLGGVGELPTVAEGAAYTELTWDDQTETTSFVKKGGYLGLTLEAMDKDDTRKLQAAPRALAQSAWLTLSKAIAAIFTSNSGAGPTMSDAAALFHATHGNLGLTALSVSAWTAARTAMRKQTELNSAERLGALTAPKYLLVPPDLEITALQVLASENDYSYVLANAQAAPANPHAEGADRAARMQLARERVVVVDLWTDTNDWAAVADPRLYPSIGLGFRYGRAPEIFSVASPTAGLMFSNDSLPVKVRFFFAVGPIDWRGLYKANVAG
jgi:hypothetical protein